MIQILVERGEPERQSAELSVFRFYGGRRVKLVVSRTRPLTRRARIPLLVERKPSRVRIGVSKSGKPACRLKVYRFGLEELTSLSDYLTEFGITVA